MSYHYLEPEVAGQLGENTVMDTSVHPPRVTRLHYVFHGWLGDAILESFPCLIVTAALAEALRRSKTTGVGFDRVEISGSHAFEERQAALPDFVWLTVSGTAGVDDFGLAGDGRYVVSDAALSVLRRYGLLHALIEAYPQS